jgi:hypothetical protein
MKSAKREKTSPQSQLAMALDTTRLQGMKSADREVAIARLACLLIEAAGIVVTGENADDHS